VSEYGAALGLEPVHVGKVRELYDWDDDTFLMVATDRVSAFDYVLPSPIPDKGKVLTQLSLWWFEQLGSLIQNHVISTAVPEPVKGRAIVVEKLKMVPVECIARGYLTGTGWAEYQLSRSVCGIKLPAGLHDGSKLPEPIFTPSTKAEIGIHDENISYEQMLKLTGAELGAKLRDTTLAVYSRAEQLARERGIILADTKFEFGRRADGTLVLADEVLTPDSSRFWDAADYTRGLLTSFDKQYLRNWLNGGESGWDKASGTTPPPLPEAIITATRERYLTAYQQLTGCAFVA
jgi:phosphoribosylaminoimidazole-succinocarboxamide synthase